MAVNFTTPEAIASYPNLFEAHITRGYESSDPSFSVNLIFPEGINLDQLKAEYMVEINRKWPDPATRPVLADKYNCFLPGSRVKGTPEQYAKCLVLKCKADQHHRPALVFNDASRTEIIDRKEIYGGVYGVARVNFYAYDDGIRCGILGFLKTRDCAQTDRLDSREDVTDMFGTVPASAKAGPTPTIPGNGVTSGQPAPQAKNPWD